MSLTLLSFAIAFIVGVIVAAWRVSPVAPLRAAGLVYTELVRNTPLTLLFLLFFFAFPFIAIGPFSPFASAIIVLGTYTSAFVAEVVRSGINAVAVGQAEAARSIGLTFPQTLRHVVLPQALRTVVAPLGNVFIALTKNSSVAYVISVAELAFIADTVTTETGQSVPAYLGAAIGYLILTLPSGWIVGSLERRLAVRR